MRRPALCFLVIPFALAGLNSCSTTEPTPAQKEAAAERRVKQATEQIRKVGRHRPSAR